ncbi:MAG: hypothetical protein ACI9U0_000590 [Flavobacteriales bacterium]|jgi:hypothetical protein
MTLMKVNKYKKDNAMKNFSVDSAQLSAVIEKSVSELNDKYGFYMEEKIAISNVSNGIQIQVVVTRKAEHHIEPSTLNLCVVSH